MDITLRKILKEIDIIPFLNHLRKKISGYGHKQFNAGIFQENILMVGNFSGINQIRKNYATRLSEGKAFLEEPNYMIVKLKKNILMIKQRIVLFNPADASDILYEVDETFSTLEYVINNMERIHRDMNKKASSEQIGFYSFFPKETKIRFYNEPSHHNIEIQMLEAEIGNSLDLIYVFEVVDERDYGVEGKFYKKAKEDFENRR